MLNRSNLALTYPIQLVVGESHMARLVREQDWSTTSLGPIEAWSETLVAQVNLVLNMPYAANLSWGPNLTFFYNDAAIETMGLQHPSGLGQGYRELFDDVWQHVGHDMEDCFLGGRCTKRENLYIPYREAGKVVERYWNYFFSPVYEGGAVAGVLQIFQDTTEAVMARLRLVREREDLLAMFEEAPAMMALLEGPEHIYKMVNRAHVKMIGEREYIGRSVLEVLPEAEKQGFIAILDEVFGSGKSFAANGARLTLQSTASHAAEEFYLDLVCSPRRDVDGTMCGIVMMGVDVTERRQAVQALIESEKVAVVGRLASSIAHEINNPLATAMNYLYLAETTESLDQVREYLGVANAELKRVSAISSQTLLSQRHAITLTAITFRDVVESALVLFQGPIRISHVRVETRYRSLEPLRCVEGELRQVISNLVSNAIDAMSSGDGRLLIRAREGTDWTTGQRVHKLTIADTGRGIAPGVKKQMFKPFFTTKGYDGNGLGLWVSQEIMARHEGRMAVRSKVGHGSVLALYLPQGMTG